MISYKKTVELLDSKKVSHIDLGLDRIKQVLCLMGNPQDKLKCIQIAGTNGKGSVAATLDTILTESKYKTGLYTSPHIFEYTERIKISGTDIKQEDFASYVQEVNKIADDNKISLTTFEILTAVMFKYFADNNVDVAILETGLGGRLDATNVIKSNICSIITHIDLDHTELLGKTKEEIATEKAGIIKKNCPVITSEGYEVFKDISDQNDSMLIIASPNIDNIYIDAFSLKGSNQIENLTLVLAAVEYLYSDINKETIVKALKKVKHPCRFQYIKDKNLIIDAAHNPNGIKSLNNNLNLYFANTKRRFIFGALKNKDYKKMIDELLSFKEYGDNRPEIFFYEFDNCACTFKDLQDCCIYYSKELKSLDSIQFDDDTLTIICGSIYMISKLVDKKTIL